MPFILCRSYCAADTVPSVCRLNHDKEVKSCDNRLRELQTNRDSLLCETSELKVQLKLVEDARDAFRANLLDANRQLSEGITGCINQSINQSIRYV